MKKQIIKYLICFLFICLYRNKLSELIAQTANLQSVYSSFFGGTERDWGGCIAVDSFGYVYISGNSFSTDLPVKSAYQSDKDDSSDAFIAKLSRICMKLFIAHTLVVVIMTLLLVLI